MERVHIEQTAPKPLSLDLINSKLPLQQVGEITEFENLLLENEDAVKQFKYIVSIAGGNSHKDTVARVLTKVFTNACAELCSWAGQQGNFAVQKLNLITLTRDTLCYTSTMQEAEFEAYVKEWFRLAGQ